MSDWLLTFLSPTQEVFTEMEEKYGEVEEMNVCDNLGDHLVGNVYVKVGVDEKHQGACSKPFNILYHIALSDFIRSLFLSQSQPHV